MPPAGPAAPKGADEGPGGGDDVGRLLTRARRMEVGQRCKELVDLGRWQWLAERGAGGGGPVSGARAELLQFVPAAVSGENRLLIWLRCL